MEEYAYVLNFAIPFFVLLISVEFLAGKAMGVNTLRSMDTISSLSSGLTNILKDVLGLTIVIFTYSWLESQVGLFDVGKAWWVFVIAFIGIDFAGYWQHRFNHTVNILWNRHIIHHSSEEYNLPCALRQSISNIVSIYTLLYLPMALIGVPGRVVMVIAPLHLFSQFWYHTRLIGKMGFLEKFLVTPSHHRVHHAINPLYIDKNYAQIFIIWDKMFGTFQVEREDIPPVYGVKKPVRTWNPFLIGFVHLWGLIKDAYRTRSWWDKLRIWFMPTGWRPADVAEKYPVEVIEDVYQYKKYETPDSLPMMVWSWFQLLFHVFLLLYLFNSLSLFAFPDILLYAGFLGISIFAYTALMDQMRFAWVFEGIKIGMGIFLFYRMDGWYMIDRILPFGNELIIGYLICAGLVSLGFSFSWHKKTAPRVEYP